MNPAYEKPKRHLRGIHPIVYILVGIGVGGGLMAGLPLLLNALTPATSITSFSDEEGKMVALDMALSVDGMLAIAVPNENGTHATIYTRRLTLEENTIPQLSGDVRLLVQGVPLFGELQFTPDGTRLIAAPDGVADNRIVRSIQVADGTSWEFAGDYITTSPEYLYIAGGNRMTHYDVTTGELVGGTASKGIKYIANIAARPDNALAEIVVLESGEAVVQFENMDAEPEDFLPEGSYSDIVFAPQGDRIIAAVDDKLLLHNMELAGATFLGTSQVGQVHRLAVINDWLAVAGASGVELWRYQTVAGYTTLLWRSDHVLTGYTESVTGLVFLPDGKHLLTAGSDGQLILWDFIAGKRIWQVKI